MWGKIYSILAKEPKETSLNNQDMYQYRNINLKRKNKCQLFEHQESESNCLQFKTTLEGRAERIIGKETIYEPNGWTKIVKHF